jgi:hypothetical protein
MSMRGSQEDGVGDAFKMEIVQVCAMPGDEAGIFSPARGIADDSTFVHCLGFLRSLAWRIQASVGQAGECHQEQAASHRSESVSTTAINRRAINTIFIFDAVTPRTDRFEERSWVQGASGTDSLRFSACAVSR